MVIELSRQTKGFSWLYRKEDPQSLAYDQQCVDESEILSDLLVLMLFLMVQSFTKMKCTSYNEQQMQDERKLEATVETTKG